MELFDLSSFDSRSLTTRANDATIVPFTEQATASLFEVDSVATETVQVDRESYGTQVLGLTQRDTVAAEIGSTRARGTYPVNSVKIGGKVVVRPSEFRSQRKTGELDLERFQDVTDRRMAEQFRHVDAAHEFHRMSSIKGAWTDERDGLIVDYRNLFNLAPLSVLDLQLGAASPKPGALRTKLTGVQRVIRDALGTVSPTGIVAYCASDAFDAIRDLKETREAFARAEDGAYLRESGLLPVAYGGARFVEYRGAALAPGEIVFVPQGVPGMLKTVFTPADHVEFVNEEGLARFVLAKNDDNGLVDFGKGWEAEVASFPVHYNLRPEAVVVATIDAGDDAGAGA